MIAASEPQEFVPSGRQQALRHPVSVEPTSKLVLNEQDDVLLNNFEKVSLGESKQNEWWVLRKSPVERAKHVDLELHKCEVNKSYAPNYTNKSLSSNLDISMHKTRDRTSRSSTRFSDVNMSKLGNKRFSMDSEAKNETKGQWDSLKTEKLENKSSLRTRISPGFMEEELYVKGKTTIWSRGLVTNEDNLDNGRKTICSYTSPTLVKQAFWCTFYSNMPIYDSNLLDVHMKVEEPTGTPVPSICIIDHHSLRVFTQKGEDFVISVPFSIKKAWSTKFGVFIENNHEDTSFDNHVTLFSLAYPQEDVCPVAVNYSNTFQILNNPNLSLVFTSEDPSICMMYDSQLKQHSVFKIRHVKPDERNFCDKTNSVCNSRNFSSSSKLLKHKYSMWDVVNSSTNVPSGLSSKPASVCNNQYSRSFSSMATISRCQSPAVSSMGSPWTAPGSRFNNSIVEKCHGMTSQSFFDHSKAMSCLKSHPSICLDHLWTDTNSTQEGASAGPASKVFLSDDFTGQWYLCYILSSRFQLSIVKIDISNPSNITFGMFTSRSAKDAVPIPHLHMLAILEHNGNVTLYSGLTVVGKLHIGGTLAQHTPSPYVRRSLNQFNSPFPRRSSLLPHCKQADFKFDEHLLSPVLPATASCSRNMMQLNSGRAVLCGLRDAVENRITLKYSDGTYYRITLPTLASSSLVESCLTCLRQCLQRDAASTFMSRWYATRNVLGTQDLTMDQEWTMFSSLLLELVGYEEDHPNEVSKEVPLTPSSAIKRQKPYSEGNDEDFSSLLSSKHAKNLSNLNTVLSLKTTTVSTEDETTPSISVNTKSVLFPYIRIIHFAFHLLYEDLKLNTLRINELLPLMKLLNKLSNDLGLINYSLLYWKDFPEHAVLHVTALISQNDLKNVNSLGDYNEKAVSVMQYILGLLEDEDVPEYPYLRNVNTRSRDIVQLCGVLSEKHKHLATDVVLDSFVKDVTDGSIAMDPPTPGFQKVSLATENTGSTAEQVVLLMVEMKLTLEQLDTLPVGIYLLLFNALWKCRENPPSDWPAEAYYLIWREDLAEQTSNSDNSRNKHRLNNQKEANQMPYSVGTEAQPIDGMEEIETTLMNLRFAEDVRVAETRKMLQSARPVPVVVVQRPGVSDHDLIEEQEKHLYAICTRTMALPVGRGMFTLRTSVPVITETLQTPPLCLSGKAPPRGTTVELTHIDIPANMSLWPLFHNGVANGLRITQDANYIDNTWIIFNKPKGNCDQSMEHAGFLMALGLNGHLKNLTIHNRYEYLTKVHEMTSVGILLGLSAAFRGTSHMHLTKTLSVHVEALLPPTSMELDVPQNLQVAALLGIGLVYQRTAHRHMTEVLLTEIGRPPGPEMENSVDRESYSLAAGLALGLVTLKHGGRPTGLSDLNVPDTLHYYMVGGNKRPLTGSQKDKYKVASFQIREGSSVNLDVTAPGATLALGLMYLGTGNKAIAKWMAPPETQYLLDFVRPDFLMLRILSRSLILWDDIEPSKEWVEGQVPSTIRPYCMVTPSPNLDVDYEAMNQAYCNIVTGASFALGLKFAGSANQDAFDTLLYFCHMFTKLTSKSIAELAGKPTIETCLNVLLLSAAMVMAGTGNLEIMRLVRHLRRRVGVSSSAVVTYGSHLATHMALGLLFLGGGRYTLSNSPESVAALICAFYPKFPTHSNDNRYHLQAFRHLYVLAVEQRLVIPKDVYLGTECYANLRVLKMDGSVIRIKGPGILPDLNTVIKVYVDDERYWPVVFERGHNWDLLLKILSGDGIIKVKQRAGCLSYIVDKYGYHSELARTLTQSGVIPWDPSPESISSFTSEESIQYFCEHFLISSKDNHNSEELKLKQKLMKVTYDAVIKDKLIMVYVFATVFKTVKELPRSPNSYNMWQLKLIIKQVLCKTDLNILMPKEALLAIQQEVADILDGWEYSLKDHLKSFTLGEQFPDENKDIINKLANYILFYDIPFNSNLVTDNTLEAIYKQNRILNQIK